MSRQRLFQLLSRREVARAARAGAAAGAAEGKARTAAEAALRHAALAAEMERTGQVIASALTAQKHLAAGLAAEAARLRAIEKGATAEANRLRLMLARHDQRRRIYVEAAAQARMAQATEADRRAALDARGPCSGGQGLASGLQGSDETPESTA
jgi:hypothetical protein